MRVSLLRRGVSLYVGPVGALGGVAVAPPISPYTGPGWSPPFCRVPLVLRSVFYVYCATFRLYSWRSFGQFPDSCVSLARPSHEGLFLGHLHGVYLGGLAVLLRALPGLCHLR